MSTPIDFPWIRQIRMTFTDLNGPGGSSGGYAGFAASNAKVYIADGSHDRLRIDCNIRKKPGLVYPAYIQIFNLSDDTRASLERKKTTVRVEAGWRSGPNGNTFYQAFIGTILDFGTSKAGTDYVTELYCISGLIPLASTVHAKRWNGTPVRDIVIELAQQLDGVTVDPGEVVNIQGKTDNDKGWASTGTVRESLDSLARLYGFNWSVVDNTFRAAGTDYSLGQVVTIEDPYLISLSPSYSTPLVIANGISWSCTFKPDMLPLNGVRIRSSISEMAKRYNGVYRCNEVMHDLSSHKRVSFITRGNAYLIPGSA